MINTIISFLSMATIFFAVNWYRAKQHDKERIKTIRLLRERVDQLEWGMMRALKAPQEDFRKVLQLHWDRYCGEEPTPDVDGLTPEDLQTLEAVEKAFPEIGTEVKELLRNNRAMQGGLTK